jgi:hypothetical protein
MNTIQIQSILGNHPLTKKTFTGVYPIDRLPTKRPPKNSSIVINSEKLNSTSNLGHWWGIYRPPKGPCEFFCSYGMDPPMELSSYLGPNYISNKRRLQGFLSATCGQYVVYFIFRRNCGSSLEDILKEFSSTKHNGNDLFVNKAVEQIFSSKLQVYYKPYISMQVALTLERFMDRKHLR